MTRCFDVNMQLSSCTAWWQNEVHKWCKVYRRKTTSYWLLLGVSSLAMLTAFPASSILSRDYYQEGGQRRWLIAWIAVAGWPLIALFLFAYYLYAKTYPTCPTWHLMLSYAFLEFLSAADNLMYSWAFSYLPASTASLVASCSLAFTAIFAYFLVGKKLNAFTFNSVGVITAAAVILALDSNSDRPAGVSKGQYAIGFILDVAGSALHGLIFAVSELVFIRLLARDSVHVILEQQTMVAFFGCVFTTIGTIVSGDFYVLRSEAKQFHQGPLAYYMVLVWGAITFQLGILGSVAVLYLTSALLAGVLNTVRVPITSIAAVMFLHDPMDGFKILSMILTMWGFGSYVYGGFVGVHNQELFPVGNELSRTASVEDGYRNLAEGEAKSERE